ncbi:MAG: hypothetical protein KDA37_17935, partial [Planctomycetales bacterium]|nr:hypothetical protein [Planctomycetales bacterium]
MATAAAMGRDELWVALPVSVVCGLCMGMVTKQQGNVYLRGGVAALALLAAVIGGKLGAVAFLTRQADLNVVSAAGSTAPAANPTQGESEEAGSEDGVVTGENDPAEPPTLAGTPQPLPAMEQLTAADYSLADGIWLAISALIAYQLGKGKQAGAASNVQADTAEPTAGAQPE